MKTKFKKRKEFIRESGGGGAAHEVPLLIGRLWDKNFVTRAAKSAITSAVPAAAVTTTGYFTAKGLHKMTQKAEERRRNKLIKKGVLKPEGADQSPVHEEEPEGEHGHFESVLEKIEGLQKKQSLKMFHELEDIRNLYREPIAAAQSDTARKVVKVAGKGVMGVGKGITAVGKKMAGGVKHVVKPKVEVRPQVSVSPQISRPQGFSQPIYPTSDPMMMAALQGGTSANSMDMPTYKMHHESVDISYESIGTAISSYMTGLYDIFSQIVEQIQDKKGWVLKDSSKTEKVKDILSRGIIDYKNPLAYNEMISQLEKIRLEGELAEAEVRPSALNIFLTKASAAGTALLAILGIFSIIYLVSNLIKKHFKEKQNLDNKLSTDKKLDIIFQGRVIPELHNLLDEILYKKITSKKLLALRMYKIIDNLSSSYKELRPYLKSWYPGTREAL